MEAIREPLWGQWYLGERLYASASTEVYALTRRTGFGRSCVVKCIRVPAGRPQELDRLQQECRVQARMADCGYAVAVLDDLTVPVYEADGVTLRQTLVLLRMERLDCLAELMREGTILTEKEIRRLAEDVLQALCFAHRLQIVHRDVKPANIYRAPSGQYKLGDFGIAARTDSPETSMMAGTAAYLAPEVAAGKESGMQADLYALGVVLYQLLNGNHLPMTDGQSTYAQVQASISARMRGVRVPRVHCHDRQLAAVVKKACQPDPRRRYRNAEQMLQALRAEKPPAAPTVLAACVIGAAIGFGAAWLTLPQPAQARQPETVQTGPQLPAEADASAEPPAPDSAAGEHRYEVVQQQLSWDDARIWCQSRGGHLAAITSAEEAALVEAMLDEAGLQAVWLGADNRNTSAGFQWVTGEPFSYAEWGIGEPNNTNGVEYYLMLMKKPVQGWVWNDSRQDGMDVFAADTCGFVCEWEEAAS